MRWDQAVDVAYPGSGAGGFAVSIVAVDAGQTAFVADSVPLTTGMDGRLGVNVPDAETNDYLDAVTENLAPFTRCGRDVDVPIGVVDDPLPIGSKIGPARCASGEQFEAAVIGSPDPGAARLHGSAIADRLSTLAKDRGIDVHFASPLLLLVFEDGRCRSSAYPGCRVVHPVEAVGVGMVESRLAVGAVDRWVDRIFIRCTGRSPDRHRPPTAGES